MLYKAGNSQNAVMLLFTGHLYNYSNLMGNYARCVNTGLIISRAYVCYGAKLKPPFGDSVSTLNSLT